MRLIVTLILLLFIAAGIVLGALNADLVAYDLGFDDISHFSKYFKKASGISFSDFRKEISQQFSFAS